MRVLEAYLLARSMKDAKKRGLTFDEWCLETGRDPEALEEPNSPLKEKLRDTYADIYPGRKCSKSS
jgi:hypothetical protein